MLGSMRGHIISILIIASAVGIPPVVTLGNGMTMIVQSCFRFRSTCSAFAIGLTCAKTDGNAVDGASLQGHTLAIRHVGPKGSARW